MSGRNGWMILSGDPWFVECQHVYVVSFSCLGSSLMLMIWWVIWCLVFSSKILIGESVWRTLTRSLHLQMKQADLSHGKQMQKGTWPRKSRNLLWVLGWHVRPRQSFQKRSSSPSIPVLMPHLLWTWVSTSHAMWWLGRSSSQVPRRFSFPVCSQRRPNRFSCTLVEVGFQNQQRSLWFKQKFPFSTSNVFLEFSISRVSSSDLFVNSQGPRFSQQSCEWGKSNWVSSWVCGCMGLLLQSLKEEVLLWIYWKFVKLSCFDALSSTGLILL